MEVEFINGAMSSVVEEMVDVKRDETMANAVEAPVLQGQRNKKKRQRRVRQQQQEGTEPKENCQRTKESESSGLPRNESDRNLEAPLPATTNHTVLRYRQRREDAGRGALGEDWRAKQKIPQ